MICTPAELFEITHKKQARAQAIVLRALGIEHKVRPDGSLLVLRLHVEQQLGAASASAKIKEIEPDWSAIS